MIDIKLLENDLQTVKDALDKRGYDTGSLNQCLSLQSIRKETIQEVESLRNKRNSLSKEVGALKKKGLEAENLIAGRIGYLFKKSWERYELTYQSMMARGFDGSFNVYYFDKLKRIDYIFICITIMLMTSIIAINLIYA